MYLLNYVYAHSKSNVLRQILKLLSEGDALALRGRSFHRDGPALLKARSPLLSLCPGNLKQATISRPETTAGCVGVQQLTDLDGRHAV